jgi:hypothetical protein
LSWKREVLRRIWWKEEEGGRWVLERRESNSQIKNLEREKEKKMKIFWLKNI